MLLHLKNKNKISIKIHQTYVDDHNNGRRNFFKTIPAKLAFSLISKIASSYLITLKKKRQKLLGEFFFFMFM